MWPECSRVPFFEHVVASCGEVLALRLVAGTIYSLFMDPEHTKRMWRAALRCRDSDDIAAGRRTPEEVNRDNV